MATNFILERAKYLIDIDITGDSTPSNIILSKFFKSNSNIGSKDREILSNIYYEYLRNFHTIQLLSRKYDLPVHIVSCLFICPNIIDYISIPISKTYNLNNRLIPQLNKLLSYIDSKYLNNIDLPLVLPEEHYNLEELTKDNNFFNHDSEVSILSDTFSLPQWFIIEIIDILNKIDQPIEFLKSFTEKPSLNIRLSSKFDLSKKDVIINNLNLVDMAWDLNERSFEVKGNSNITSSHWYQNGLIEIQDKSSQLVGLIASSLNPKTVLDACAGAGGKALHLQDLIENVIIHAYDNNQKRLARTLPRIERQKIKNIDLLNNKNFFNDTYDLILIDAPCTGSGTIRRQSEIKLRLDQEQVLQYQNQQMEIVDEYINYLSKGSYLIYSTCSLFKKENSDINKYLVDKYNLERINIFKLIPELKNYNLIQFYENEVYISPHVFNSDGFYISVFKCTN